MTSKFSLCAVGLLSIGSITASNIAIASSPSEINTQLKWSWQGSSFKPESNQVMAAPIVAQLNDDNGDGKIDEDERGDVKEWRKEQKEERREKRKERKERSQD